MRVSSAIFLAGGFFLGAIATDECPDDTVYNYDACPADSKDLLTDETCPYAAPVRKRGLVASPKFLFARNDLICDDPDVYECPNKACKATESSAYGETAEIMACGGKTCGTKTKDGKAVATVGPCKDDASKKCITIVLEPPEGRTIDDKSGVQLETKTGPLTSSGTYGFRFSKYCVPSDGETYSCVVPVELITTDDLCPTETAFYISVHYNIRGGGWHLPEESCWPADISNYDNVTPIDGKDDKKPWNPWGPWKRGFGFGNFVFGGGVKGWDNDYKDYSKNKKGEVATQFKLEYECKEKCTDYCCCADKACDPETAYAAPTAAEDWACDVAQTLPENYPYCYRWLRHVPECQHGAWGWQVEIPVPVGEATYSFDLFPSATTQHQRHGAVAGTVEVAISGGAITDVEYKATEGYRLVDAHAYAGCQSIAGPTGGKCRTPSVYDKVSGEGVAGASAGTLCTAGGDSWSWSPDVMCAESGRFYVVFHATVQKDVETCSCPVKVI